MTCHVKDCIFIAISYSIVSQHYTALLPTRQRIVLHKRKRSVPPCGSSRLLLASGFRRPWFWLDFQKQTVQKKSCARWYDAATNNDSLYDQRSGDVQIWHQAVLPYLDRPEQQWGDGWRRIFWVFKKFQYEIIFRCCNCERTVDCYQSWQWRGPIKFRPPHIFAIPRIHFLPRRAQHNCRHTGDGPKLWPVSNCHPNKPTTNNRRAPSYQCNEVSFTMDYQARCFWWWWYTDRVDCWVDVSEGIWLHP